MQYPCRIIHLLKKYKRISIYEPWISIRGFLSEFIFRHGFYHGHCMDTLTREKHKHVSFQVFVFLRRNKQNEWKLTKKKTNKKVRQYMLNKKWLNCSCLVWKNWCYKYTIFWGDINTKVRCLNVPFFWTIRRPKKLKQRPTDECIIQTPSRVTSIFCTA